MSLLQEVGTTVPAALKEEKKTENIRKAEPAFSIYYNSYNN